MKPISEVIREERQKQGLSMQALADLAGVTKRSIVYWENHGRDMTIESADKVLKALGISITIGAGNGEQ